MKKKIALVTGICGQTEFISRILLNKNYKVVGADRRSSKIQLRLKELGI